MLSKQRLKTFLKQLKFNHDKGSSIWHRDEVTCSFGRSEGKTIFSMNSWVPTLTRTRPPARRNIPESPIRYISYNLDEISLDTVITYMSRIESMKQEIREIQLKNILELT